MEQMKITTTYTGMAGHTMHRAVGLTVERGQAAVTGLGRRMRVRVHRNRGGHTAGKLMAGAGVAPASLPDLASHRIRRCLT